MSSILQFLDGEINSEPSKIKFAYHYTSPDGILSIIDHNNLRFTDGQYLNDKSEYVYIKKPLIKALKSIGEEVNEPFLDRLLFTDPYTETSIEKLKTEETSPTKKFKLRLNHYRFYLFCMSLNKDSQNMWNYYVKNGQYLGYNLKIDLDKLLNRLEKLSNVTITHGKVLYNENMQIEIISDFLRRLHQKIAPLEKEYQEAKKNGYIYSQLEEELADEYQTDLLNYINERRLFFKHNAFKSENEYRIVIKVPDDNTDDDFEMKHRLSTNGVITPYRELSMGEFLLFERITLSPMLEIDLARTGLESILKQLNKRVEIVKSDIDIRF